MIIVVTKTIVLWRTVLGLPDLDDKWLAKSVCSKEFLFRRLGEDPRLLRASYIRLHFLLLRGMGSGSV